MTDYKMKAAEEAYRAASNVVRMFDAKASGKAWPGCDYVGEKLMAEQIAGMATFVRENPTAPAEALYRFANGQGIHTGDPDGWPDLAPQFVAAYETFQHSLLMFDRLLTQVLERQIADVAVNAEPVPAAYLALPEEDRLDRPHPDPLATNPNFVLTTIDPFLPADPEFGGIVPDVPAIPIAIESPVAETDPSCEPDLSGETAPREVSSEPPAA